MLLSGFNLWPENFLVSWCLRVMKETMVNRILSRPIVFRDGSCRQVRNTVFLTDICSTEVWKFISTDCSKFRQGTVLGRQRQLPILGQELLSSVWTPSLATCSIHAQARLTKEISSAASLVTSELNLRLAGHRYIHRAHQPETIV
jgi:hypothetical protein